MGFVRGQAGSRSVNHQPGRKGPGGWGQRGGWPAAVCGGPGRRAALVSAQVPVGRGRNFSGREGGMWEPAHPGQELDPRAARLGGYPACTPRGSSWPSGHPGPIHAAGQPPEGSPRQCTRPSPQDIGACTVSSIRPVRGERRRARRAPDGALYAPGGALRGPILLLLTRGATG